MTDFQQHAQDAILKALRDGTWPELPWLAQLVQEHGLAVLLQNAAPDAKTTTAGAVEANVAGEEEGPGWPEWATWRVQLPGSTPSVVYFSRKPQYAELKAFAGAAGVAPDACMAEERQ